MKNKFEISPELQTLLNRFQVVELEDLMGGAQMERIDRKFPFHISKLPLVLSGLEKDYKIINAFGNLLSPYETLYLDTPDKAFYQIHHNGILYRDKARFRLYANTQTAFLELKRKSNKSRTAKWRIRVDNIHFPLVAREIEFLEKYLPPETVRSLQPSVRIKYERLAFVGEDQDERFSIDFNIRSKYDGKTSNFGNVVILEVKQDHIYTSPIISHMQKLRIKEGGMSKYCLNLVRQETRLKSNLFKPSLRRLEKIMHG